MNLFFSKYEQLNIYGSLSLIKGQWGQTRDKTVEIYPCTLLSFFLSVDFNNFRVICVGIPGEISFFIGK